MKVFTLGYSTLGSQEYLDGLLSEPNVLLIDTRIKPYSWNRIWCKEELEKAYGERYRWAGKYLGNKGLGSGTIEIANPVVGIQGLISYLNKGHDLVLLCQCKTLSTCHVQTIVDMLMISAYNANIDIEVVQYVNTPELCIKCQKEATLRSPSGTPYCDRCGQCGRKVYGTMSGVAVLREECKKTVADFVMHPRLGVYVCSCVLDFEQEFFSNDMEVAA